MPRNSWPSASHQDYPNFELRQYGFQEFGELLNYAQDKGLVRIQADEEKGITVYLGAEFHPPAAPPVPEPTVEEIEEEEDEPQPSWFQDSPTATGEILPARASAPSRSAGPQCAGAQASHRKRDR